MSTCSYGMFGHEGSSCKASRHLDKIFIRYQAPRPWVVVVHQGLHLSLADFDAVITQSLACFRGDGMVALNHKR